jgi:hypothetical protein
MFNSIRWSAKRRRSGRTSDRPAECTCASSNSFLSCIHAMTRVGGGKITESRPTVPPVAYDRFARTTEGGRGEERSVARREGCVAASLPRHIRPVRIFCSSGAPQMSTSTGAKQSSGVRCLAR